MWFFQLWLLKKAVFKGRQHLFGSLDLFGNKSQFLANASYSFIFHLMSSDLLAQSFSSFPKDILLAPDLILNMTIFR